MEENQTFNCRLYLPDTHYKQLKAEIKDIFTKAKGSNMYFTDFPAGFEGGDLGEYITAFIEIALISGNDKYEIADDTEVSCEMFKLGQTEKNFSIIVTIKYSNSDKDFNEILNFNKLEETDDYFSFELMGDQTMFSIE